MSAIRHAHITTGHHTIFESQLIHMLTYVYTSLAIFKPVDLNFYLM